MTRYICFLKSEKTKFEEPPEAEVWHSKGMTKKKKKTKKKVNLELNHGNGNFEQLIQSDKSNVRKEMMENLNFILELDL